MEKSLVNINQKKISGKCWGIKNLWGHSLGSQSEIVYMVNIKSVYTFLDKAIHFILNCTLHNQWQEDFVN